MFLSFRLNSLTIIKKLHESLNVFFLAIYDAFSESFEILARSYKKKKNDKFKPS